MHQKQTIVHKPQKIWFTDHPSYLDINITLEELEQILALPSFRNALADDHFACATMVEAVRRALNDFAQVADGATLTVSLRIEQDSHGTGPVHIFEGVPRIVH